MRRFVDVDWSGYRTHMAIDEYAGKVPYHWELASSAGAAFYLIRMPETTDEEIKEAKAIICRDHDVVGLRVVKYIGESAMTRD